jgi:hypothetical protein
MTFKPKDLTGWCEQEVREFIIFPMIQRLGYEKGTANNISLGTELKLTYPFDVLGRPKKTDREVKGRPDYVLDVDGKKRWVIEAKPADEQIDLACIWQAYSYARHGEVRAVCFCLCNGRELQIFATDSTPEAAHVRTFTYDQFEEEFDTIANILSPEAIKKAWPEPLIDIERPLGPGLRSFSRVIGGNFRYTRSDIAHPIITEMVFTITGGSIERKDGQLVARITTQSPFDSAQRMSEMVGFDRMHLSSDDQTLSIDPDRPTRFRSTSSYIVPKGARVLDFEYPQDVRVDSETVVSSYLEGTKLMGTFEAWMRIHLHGSPMSALTGTFEAFLE